MSVAHPKQFALHIVGQSAVFHSGQVKALSKNSWERGVCPWLLIRSIWWRCLNLAEGSGHINPTLKPHRKLGFLSSDPDPPPGIRYNTIPIVIPSELVRAQDLTAVQTPDPNDRYLWPATQANGSVAPDMILACLGLLTLGCVTTCQLCSFGPCPPLSFPCAPIPIFLN